MAVSYNSFETITEIIKSFIRPWSKTYSCKREFMSPNVECWDDSGCLVFRINSIDCYKEGDLISASVSQANAYHLSHQLWTGIIKVPL